MAEPKKNRNRSELAAADSPSSGEGPKSITGIYANGFTLGLSNADISITLRLDQESTHSIHLSYTLAKTLRDKLTDMIDRLEKYTGREIMTTIETNDAFNKLIAELQKKGTHGSEH